MSNRHTWKTEELVLNLSQMILHGCRRHSQCLSMLQVCSLKLLSISVETLRNLDFLFSFKVLFVNPLDAQSIELIKVVNELLQNSFPVRYFAQFYIHL